MKFPFPLEVPYLCQTITLAEGAMTEPLQAGLKDVLRNLLIGCIHCTKSEVFHEGFLQ